MEIQINENKDFKDKLKGHFCIGTCITGHRSHFSNQKVLDRWID